MRPLFRRLAVFVTRGALPVALALSALSPVAADEATYVVQPGDSLWRIANRFQVSTAQIAAANGLTDADLILVGQRLVIPGAATATASDSSAPRQTARAASANSLLADYRIVTYYGHPSTGLMGILGQLTPEDLVATLKSRAAQYEAAGSRPVIPAIHFIVTVAQASPGADGLYRARTSLEDVEEYARLAEANGMLLIIDVQPGRSTVEAELEPWRDLLSRSSVHLALDPEFNMWGDQEPGVQLGHMTADEINYAIDFLTEIAESNGLPNKILIVHQFAASMITDKGAIRDSARVDFVTDMDGFGGQGIKTRHYEWYVRDELVEYAGIKLFLDQDTGLMTPAEALSLDPSPNVIIYQ
ncbi:MAG: LysM peptidoglycan-binding domain-containing protein [Chloroflexi bacterium]|nr:LysM peptidoglycan-binding domain-containing protein [Chloroflexota bacterium]